MLLDFLMFHFVLEFKTLKFYPVVHHFDHSHKKRKDSLETQAVLMIFSLEIEISGVAIQSIHQKQRKMATFVRNCLVKMTLRMF